MTKLPEQLEQLRVTPGKPARLADRDPRDTLGLDGKGAASDLLEHLGDDLDGLHDRLWAEAEALLKETLPPR